MRSQKAQISQKAQSHEERHIKAFPLCGFVALCENRFFTTLLILSLRGLCEIIIPECSYRGPVSENIKLTSYPDPSASSGRSGMTVQDLVKKWRFYGSGRDKDRDPLGGS